MQAFICILDRLALSCFFLNLNESVLGFETILGLIRSPSEIIARGFGEFLVFRGLALLAGVPVWFLTQKLRSPNLGIASSAFATVLLVVLALIGLHHPDLPLENIGLRGTLSDNAL
jgi:hypothetical protein